jgi:hypothetical protein
MSRIDVSFVCHLSASQRIQYIDTCAMELMSPNAELSRRDAMRQEEEWKLENAKRSAEMHQKQIQLANAVRSEMTRRRREDAQARKAEQDAEQHRQRQHAMQEKILLSERRRVQTARTTTSIFSQRHPSNDTAPSTAAANAPVVSTKGAISRSSYHRLVGRNHSAMLMLSRRVHKDPIGFMKGLIDENGVDSDAFQLARPPTTWR